MTVYYLFEGGLLTCYISIDQLLVTDLGDHFSTFYGSKRRSVADIVPPMVMPCVSLAVCFFYVFCVKWFRKYNQKFKIASFIHNFAARLNIKDGKI